MLQNLSNGSRNKLCVVSFLSMDVKELNAHKNVIISIEMSVNGKNDHNKGCFAHKFQA